MPSPPPALMPTCRDPDDNWPPSDHPRNPRRKEPPITLCQVGASPVTWAVVGGILLVTLVLVWCHYWRQRDRIHREGEERRRIKDQLLARAQRSVVSGNGGGEDLEAFLEGTALNTVIVASGNNLRMVLTPTREEPLPQPKQPEELVV